MIIFDFYRNCSSSKDTGGESRTSVYLYHNFKSSIRGPLKHHVATILKHLTLARITTIFPRLADTPWLDHSQSLLKKLWMASSTHWKIKVGGVGMCHFYCTYRSSEDTGVWILTFTYSYFECFFHFSKNHCRGCFCVDRCNLNRKINLQCNDWNCR